MRDPRFQALAAQLAGYSTSLRPGDRVLLELTDIPEEMGIALIREVRKAGAMPFLRLNQSRLNREMLSGATEEQYGIIGRHRLAEMEDMDAYIEIRGGGNAFELSSVPQENMAAAMKALNPVSQRRIRHTRWCGLRWPSGGMAQQAAMSTEEFEDFYFHTCLMQAVFSVTLAQRVYFQRIFHGNRVEDGLQVMVTVRSFFCNIQSQVYFSIRKSKHR